MNGRGRIFLMTAVLAAALAAGTVYPAFARSMADRERGSTMKTDSPMDGEPAVITLTKGDPGAADPNYYQLLDGDGWLLEQDSSASWDSAYKVSVPSSISGALYAAGIIKNPTEGLNDAAAKELGTHDWFYRKDFDYTGSGKNVWLCFDGVADRMTVYLNGTEVGSHQGMFGGPYIDVTGQIKQGANTLVVALQPVLPYQETVVFNCSYAWHYADLPPIGIWQSVYIRDNAAVSLDHPFITTVSHETGTMDYYTEIVPASDAQTVRGTLTVTVKPKNFEGAAYTGTYEIDAKTAGTAQVRLRFDIPEFRLWWPNGYGDQPLYQLISVFETADGSRSVECSDFAVRTLELVSAVEKESTARYNRAAVINGKRVFLRGGNWCTIDATMHFSREDYDRILNRAKDQGLNAFRAWGGGLVETDEFYELCDEYGIMVYQEWPCCWDSQKTQPEDVLYETVILNTKRLRNHPSLLVYGGGNEGEGTPEDKVLNNIGKLTYQYDGTRDFWRQDGGVGANGIIHDHIHWGGETPEHYLELYTDVDRNFHEYGLDAMMNLESIAKYATEAEMAEWPIDPAGVVAYHTATFNGMKGWNPTPYGYDIDNFIYRASQFVTVSSLESLVTGSQLSQTMADYPAAVNARISDPIQTMLFYYKFNDVYPGASWSVVDWYGSPKMAYWFLQDAFSSLLAAPKLHKYDIAGDIRCELPVYLLDDRGELAGKDWTVTVKAYDRDMTRLAEQSFSGKGEVDAPYQVGTVTLPAEAINSCPLYIVCDVTSGGKLLSRYYIPLNCDLEPDSLYMAPAVKLEMTLSGNTVTVTNTDRLPAAGVQLLCPSASDTVRLSDNYFWLEPGESREITVSDPQAIEGLSGFNVISTGVTSRPANVNYIEAVSREADSVELSWEFNGEDKVRYFEIYCDGTEVARVSGSRRSAAVSGLLEHTEYRFQILAVNEGMLRSKSSPEIVITTRYDRTAPRTTYVVKEDASHYLLTFSKDMDADSAGEISHYLLSEGSVVSAALLEDRRTVRLEVENAGDFVLTVAGVRDASLSANPSEKYLYSSGGAVVGHWSLDGTDETGRDESGYHEGTFRYGRAAAAEGRFNEARQLNGAGIELAETDLRLIGNTYSFWYRPAGFSGFNVLLSKGEKATGHFEIYTNEGALMLYAPDIGDLSFKVNLKTDIAQNKWHHFCFVCESKRIICYIDGEKRGTAAISCDIAALNGTLVLGSLVHDVFPATGTFDELLIIASPLDEAGVNALYTGTFLPYAKLSEAYVRLTPGEARTLTLSEQFLAACPGAQYTWSSSNEAVATVDAEGKVHAAADGEAVIYIRSTEGYDGAPFADFCVVEVGEPLPDNPESSVSAGTRSDAAAKKAGHKALIIAAAAGGAVILACALALVLLLKKKK